LPNTLGDSSEWADDDDGEAMEEAEGGGKNVVDVDVDVEGTLLPAPPSTAATVGEKSEAVSRCETAIDGDMNSCCALSGEPLTTAPVPPLPRRESGAGTVMAMLGVVVGVAEGEKEDVPSGAGSVCDKLSGPACCCG
jgi:hypothetical protein